MDLDVRRLRVLREVAVRGTVAAAAASLGYTPSAVSQQLSALERESRTVLVERAGRRLRLTDAGRVLVDRTEAILAALEEAVGALESSQVTVTGTVTLSSIPSVAAPLVIPTIASLATEHPDLDVTMLDVPVPSSLTELRLGSLDVVVAHEYQHARIPADADVVRSELLTEDMYVAAPHGRFRKGTVPLADLAAEKWAVEPPDSSCGHAVREACRAAGFEPDARFSSTEFSVLFAAVQAGAVSLLPGLAFLGMPEGVSVHRVSDVPTTRTVFVAHRRGGRARPGVALVLDRLETNAVALRRRVKGFGRVGTSES